MVYSLSQELSQKQSQNVKQIQRLIMSPQMQQALHLLQMPIMELAAIIETEIEQNPLLEITEDEAEVGDENEEEIIIDEELAEKELTFDERNLEILKQLDEDFRDHFDQNDPSIVKKTKESEKLKNFLENSICSELTLFQYLMQQARETFEDDEEIKMAEAIIGNLDDSGYLSISLEEIAMTNDFDLKILKNILMQIQNFEPTGIAATHLKECLLIQLKCQNKENLLAYEIVEKHLDDLMHNRIPIICKSLNCSVGDIEDALTKHITKLELHPGVGFVKPLVQYIVPDVTIVNDENHRLSIVVNHDELPLFHLNSRYLRMLEDETLPLETKNFIQKKILSAKWLMRNINQRSDTIEKIAQSLIKHQSDFLLNPEGKLAPMTMKMLSEELGLHESTIARAVASKYIQCPRGILPLRSFFSNAYVSREGDNISSNTVRDILWEIIQGEDKNKPFSDETISDKIKEKGVPCARRTIAKYRKILNIGNARQRKKFS